MFLYYSQERVLSTTGILQDVQNDGILVQKSKTSFVLYHLVHDWNHSFSLLNKTSILSFSDGFKVNLDWKKKGNVREVEVKLNPFSKQ